MSAPPPYSQQGYAPPVQPGYPPQQAYPPQKAYPPQAQPGYPPPQQGYAPPQQGYAPPPQGYAPPPQGYAPPPQGYAPPPQGYAPQGQPGVVVVSTTAPQPTVVHTTTVVNRRNEVNHLLHCLITLLFWPWIIVWIILCMTEGS